MAKATMTTLQNAPVSGEDPRFEEVRSSKRSATKENKAFYDKQAKEINSAYDEAIGGLDKHTEKIVNAQNEQTDLAIEKLEVAQDRAEQDYQKEQRGAYADYQKQINPYGANAEAMAAQGLNGTGYAESSKVSMYNTYQNRVAIARQSFERVSADFELGMREARAQNSAALAEIYYNAYKEKSALILNKIVANQEIWKAWQTQQNVIDSRHDNLWQNVYSQINAEESRKLQERAIKLDEDKFKYQKEQDAKAAAKLTVGGGGGSPIYSGIKNKGKRDYSNLAGNQLKNINLKPRTSKEPEIDSDSIKTSKELEIDIDSLEAMGLSKSTGGDKLAQMEDDGLVESYIEDGKIKFKWAKMKSTLGGAGAVVRNGRPQRVQFKD